MRYSITILVSLFILLKSIGVNAQAFTVINDTITITAAPGISDYYDSIVTGAAAVTYSWHIIYCNFPSDWLSPSAAAFCDDSDCRNLNFLWPSTDTNRTDPYASHDTGVLKLALDLLATATSSCYYVTARLHSITSYADSATETWSVCYTAPSSISSIGSVAININIYPNPVKDKLYLSCVPGSDIKNVELYNLQGIRMKTVSCDAAIPVADMPPGIYLLRALDAYGNSIREIKFLKE